jgi:M6 family metalloprotease-like protein
MGDPTSGVDASMNPVFRATSIAAAERLSSVQGAPQLGQKKYLVILCKFADYPAPEAYGKAAYQSWIGEGALTRAFPSINSYWYEQSYGKMNFDNSVVKGWYTLPHNRVYYLQADTTTDDVFADLTKLLTDCTAVADPDVNFPDYIGVVVQFNKVLDGYSWGGQGWTLNYDGQSKVYGVAWMADWAVQSVYVHESGHSLGLPHSSGNYGATYDSDWDVMSNSYLYPKAYNGGNYIGEGTISYNRDLLGWISASRKVVVGNNTQRTVFVDRLTRPGANTTPLMVTIPYGGASDYYTVESRRFAGYDTLLDAEGVIIHQITPNRGSGRPAYIVDRKLDGNAMPDASAAFFQGETFTDGTEGITVAVNAMTPTGYGVTVTHGDPSNTWNAQSVAPTVREKSVAVAVGTDLYVLGGVTGSGAVLTRNDIYSTKTDLWRTARAMPRARSATAAANYNGSIYVFGGKDALGTWQSTVWKYNPGTNSWATKTSMPAAGGCGGAATIGTKIYVFVGCNSVSDHTNLLYRYDPVANTWKKLASSARVHATPVVAALGGKLYVVGGLGNDGNPSAAVDIFNPVAGTWANGTSLPVAAAGAAGGVFNNLLYVTGGLRTLTTLVASSYVYNPVPKTWASKVGLPTKRARLAGIFVGNTFHTVGGSTLVPNVLNKHEVYHP